MAHTRRRLAPVLDRFGPARPQSQRSPRSPILHHFTKSVSTTVVSDPALGSALIIFNTMGGALATSDADGQRTCIDSAMRRTRCPPFPPPRHRSR